MSALFLWLWLSGLILSVLLILSSMFSSEDWMNEDDSKTPFECGMDPVQAKKVPFYMHFFYISILFLVFDIELVMIFPLVYSSMDEWEHSLFWFSFFFILIIGLVMEVYLGTLSWKE